MSATHPSLTPRWPDPHPPPRSLECKLAGHRDRVERCAWFCDDTRLATASSDGTVRIWDTRSGAALHVLAHGSGRAHCVVELAVADDGTWLVTALLDGSAWIWDTDTGTLRGLIEGVGRNLLLSRAGDRLASSRHYAVVVHDVATGAVLRRLEAEHELVACGWLADDVSLVITHANGSVSVWQTDIDDEHIVIAADSHLPASGVVATDGTWAAVESMDDLSVWTPEHGLVRAPEREFGRLLAAAGTASEPRLLIERDGLKLLDVLHSRTQPLDGPLRWIVSAAFGRDPNWIAGATEDGVVWIWDVTRASAEPPADERPARPVRACAAAPDGTWAVTGEPDGLRVRDPETGRVLRVLRESDWSPAPFVCVAAPDSSWLAADDHEHLHIWAMPEGTLRHTLEAGVLPGYVLRNGPINSILGAAVSPDGRRLVTAGEDGFVRVWDPITGEPGEWWNPDEGRLFDVFVIPDASGILHCAGEITHRWDPVSQQRRSYPRPSSALVAHPTELALIAGIRADTIEIWSLASGELLRELDDARGVSCCRFSPDGAWLAGCIDDLVCIWDIADGTQRASMQLDGRLHGLCWLPDNRGLCVVGEAGSFAFDFEPGT